jgi:hypothetical protein
VCKKDLNHAINSGASLAERHKVHGLLMPFDKLDNLGYNAYSRKEHRNGMET